MARIRPNSAVIAARARRAARAGALQQRGTWFIDRVFSAVSMSVGARMHLMMGYLKTRVVENISIPVGKSRNALGRVIVTERSKPGEFPRADTTLLMKSIFDGIREIRPGLWEGWVGTPLDYGLVLEIRKNRSFLLRTLHEERDKLKAIASGPIR